MGENILVFCAHNDDHIIGCGGTIAKYAKEGKNVKVVIFSYGEMSHPHLKKKFIIKTRVKESQRADKILGFGQATYLGIDEVGFDKQIKERKIVDNVIRTIKGYNPSKIFTHIMDDAHSFHRAVNSTVLEAVDKMKYKGEVYGFDVWHLVQIKKRGVPKLVVDISSTFKKKVDAFNAHKSQQMAIWTLMWGVYLKAILNGWKNDVKYAEVFRKIR